MIKSELNLTDIFNAMIKNKKDWININDDNKEKFFFIINRMFSKKYTEKSLLLNRKNTDKAVAMDLWFNFMKTQPYPSWFWSKSEKNIKSEYTEADMKMLEKKLNIKRIDLEYLINKHSDFIKEEYKYFKNLEKQ